MVRAPSKLYGFLVCLLIIRASADTSRISTQNADPLETVKRERAFYHSIQLRFPTNTPRHHSDRLLHDIISLYQHSYRLCSGSIKRGFLEARFVESLFKLDSTVRHWHFKRLKSKAQKGYIIRTFFVGTCVCVHVSSFVTYS